MRKPFRDARRSVRNTVYDDSYLERDPAPFKDWEVPGECRPEAPLLVPGWNDQRDAGAARLRTCRKRTPPPI